MRDNWIIHPHGFVWYVTSAPLAETRRRAAIRAAVSIPRAPPGDQVQEEPAGSAVKLIGLSAEAFLSSSLTSPPAAFTSNTFSSVHTPGAGFIF